MKPATVRELKSRLDIQSHEELVEACLRLARFKSENKELLTYLLYEAGDEDAYVNHCREAIDEAFADIHTENLYYARKNLRRILRQIGRFARYSGIKTTEIALLIHFLEKLKESGMRINDSQAIARLVESQVKKINKLISTLHEDLQYDFHRALKALEF